MTSLIEAVQDFNELARFLAELNSQKTCHIGYCGEKVEEIHEILKEDFVCADGQSTFKIARRGNGKIVVAIGLDIDGQSARSMGAVYYKYYT